MNSKRFMFAYPIYIYDLPSCNLLSMYLTQSWLRANKLTLNGKKTKFMLIGSKFKLSQIHNDFTVKVHPIIV